MFTNHINTVCVSGEVNKVIVRNEYDTIMLILDNKQEMERNGKIEMVVSSIQVKIPCLLYTSPSPRDKRQSRMPSSA